MRFDRVGVFAYSYEADTPSGQMPDQVPAEVAAQRRDALMAQQQQISLMRNQQFVGKTLTTLIEGQNDGLSVGRTYRDAPEVDGLVIIEGTVPAGEMVPVKITGAMEYDLTGTVQVDPALIVL
jgi:ribosomal protein S12 methylthiotransferase